MVGEIHLANIYFTDGSSAKVRPVLLLKKNSFNDFLFLPLTSNTSTNGIMIENSNLQDGFLPKTSIAIYEKPSIISPNLLIRKIATVNSGTYKNIISEFTSFLNK